MSPIRKSLPIFVELFNWPRKAASLSKSEWDLVIRQGRHSGLLARLYHKLSDAGQLPRVPSVVILHLESDALVTRRHARSIQFEVECLCRVLERLHAPIVLLKGSAYLMAELPPATGRLFGDIDIMVPNNKLELAEQLLTMIGGWRGKTTSEYDQRYYRKWMHEIPPMQHIHRKSELDLHHAIVPETARIRPAMEKLWQSIVVVNEEKNLYRLSDYDLVLHSAVHLFNDGEFKQGLRDLEDISSLLQYCCKELSDWQNLLTRASELQLQSPLYYALYFCSEFLNLEVPETVLVDSQRRSGNGRFSQWLLHRMFKRGLLPWHPSTSDFWTPLALWCLYVRSHYLRMPLRLLIPHLFHKSVTGPFIDWQNERKSKPEETQH